MPIKKSVCRIIYYLIVPNTGFNFKFVSVNFSKLDWVIFFKSPKSQDMNIEKILTLFVVLSGIAVLPSFSQVDSVSNRYAVSDTLDEDLKLFESDDLLEISLMFDITHYRRNRDDTEYLPATLIYHTSATDSMVRQLKVRCRGISRRSICSFPPLMLNFQQKDSFEGEFSKVDKIKMVTHCSAGGEDNLLKEYLAYKLYNALTENSFRVRLLRVNYINTFKESKPVSSFAFVIEPKESLCKRLDAIEAKSMMNITQKDIRPEVMDRLAIFEYMIGNTDWTVPVFHNNVVILSQSNTQGLEPGIAVAYDFDYSGLVNASYAVPADQLKLKSVLERRYLGICRSEETFTVALKEFTDKREDFYRLIDDFPYLNPKVKKQMILYLDSFYSGFDKRNSIVYTLLRDCIKF